MFVKGLRFGGEVFFVRFNYGALMQKKMLHPQKVVMCVPAKKVCHIHVSLQNRRKDAR